MSNTTKQCTQCETIKDLSEFHKDSYSKDGTRHKCKPCLKMNSFNRSQTKDGMITTIYGNQCTHSTTRGHNPPSYTNQELKSWLLTKTNFNELYGNWVKSGYSKSLKPSVDRIDDFKGYTFDNITLMTWGENNAKGHKNRFNGISTQGSLCKPVMQLSMNGEFIKEYYSHSEARRVTNINHISCVCLGKRNNAGGFKWEYKD